MSNLVGKTIESSYDQLLITTHDSGVSGTTRVTTGASDNATVLYLKSDAVGINQGTPTTTLDVSGTFKVSGSATFSSTATISGDATMGGNIIMADDTSIGIGDSSERIEFDGAGDISFLGCKVGIGESAPDTALHIIDNSGELKFAGDSSSGSYISVGTNQYLRFLLDDGSFEAMRIIDGGFVGINTPAPGQALEVRGKASEDSNIKVTTVNENYNAGILLCEETTARWQIYNDGTGHSGTGGSGGDDTLVIGDSNNDDGMYLSQGGSAWADHSDARSKTSLKPIENAVDKLNTLQAVNYKWKYGSKERRTRNNLGLIAQEVYKVFPEAVASCDESLYKVIDHPTLEGEKQVQGQWGISSTTLIPVLVKAVQELSAKVDALEKKNKK